MNILLRSSKGKDERLKVFIVDDSREIREKVKDYLTSQTPAWIIGEAENVNDALTALSDVNPDVVFLDIKLGGESGMSVLVHLKKTKPMIKIVMFSNSADDYYRRKFKECGCDYFIDKSKEFSLIPEVIKNIQISNGDWDFPDTL